MPSFSAPKPTSRPVARIWTVLRQWFDTAPIEGAGIAADHGIDWLRVLPFVALHVACLAVIWVGVSWTAICAADARRWWQRWRLFWMACAELFGYDHGNQWLVAHYRFHKRG